MIMKSTLQNFPFNTRCDYFDFSIAVVETLTFHLMSVCFDGLVRAIQHIAMLVRVHVKQSYRIVRLPCT